MAQGQNKVRLPEPTYEKRESLDVRGRLIQEFGNDTVLWAELSVVVQLMFALGIIKESEFIDLVRKQCIKVDARRRHDAGFRD